MKEKDLIKMGFKKQSLNEDYWYELKTRQHKFFTNDTSYNNRKDRWIIGYENTRTKEEFWFNQNLDEVGDFEIIYKVLIGEVFNPQSLKP